MPDAVSFLVEDCDKFVADDAPLFLRIGHPRQLGEETLGGIHRNQVQPKLVTQVLLYLLKLVLAQHPIVDENAGESVAYSPVYQCGRHRGINPSGQSADGATCGAHPLADFFDAVLYKALPCPGRLGSTNVEREIAQDLVSQTGVVYLRVELHSPPFLLWIFDCRHRIGGLSSQMEARG